MNEFYTVSYLQRINKTVRADGPRQALYIACPWWNASQPSIDGNVVIGVVKGLDAVTSGFEAPKPPAGTPPSGPTPGTPTIAGHVNVEAKAA